jgi:hypothetical protein
MRIWFNEHNKTLRCAQVTMACFASHCTRERSEVQVL